MHDSDASAPRERRFVSHESEYFGKAFATSSIVMPALVAGIHVFLSRTAKDVDGPVKPAMTGEDDVPNAPRSLPTAARPALIGG